MGARHKFMLVQNGPDYFDYRADIQIGKDKFLVVTASMPLSKAEGSAYLCLMLDDKANPVDLGEVKISDKLFCEITGHKNIPLNMRPDFEFGVECGYWLCQVCGKPWYPMEVEVGEIENMHECPQCLGKLERHNDHYALTHGWERIPWDGNPDLGLFCWRKKFGRGHISVGIGEFYSVVYSFGANSDDSFSSTRARAAGEAHCTEEETMREVDRQYSKRS